MIWQTATFDPTERGCGTAAGRRKPEWQVRRSLNPGKGTYIFLGSSNGVSPWHFQVLRSRLQRDGRKEGGAIRDDTEYVEALPGEYAILTMQTCSTEYSVGNSTIRIPI